MPEQSEVLLTQEALLRHEYTVVPHATTSAFRTAPTSTEPVKRTVRLRVLATLILESPSLANQLRTPNDPDNEVLGRCYE